MPIGEKGAIALSKNGVAKRVPAAYAAEGVLGYENGDRSGC
jgi:hypothetical protein